VPAGTNAHMFITDPTNQWAFVPCKGSDYVAQYAFGADGMLSANAAAHMMTAAGAGPRHLAFATASHHAYLIDENASTLMALAYDPAQGVLAPIQTTTTRAATATGANTGAEVVVHPSEKFVYGSNRGDDDIAVFAIGSDGVVTLTGNTPTGGATPRSFAIDPTGRWLLAANQGGNTVTAFRIDATTGALTATGSPTAAMSPAFVGFLALP
jgi:6-phosphogluconolactonase